MLSPIHFLGFCELPFPTDVCSIHGSKDSCLCNSPWHQPSKSTNFKLSWVFSSTVCRCCINGNCEALRALLLRYTFFLRLELHCEIGCLLKKAQLIDGHLGVLDWLADTIVLLFMAMPHHDDPYQVPVLVACNANSPSHHNADRIRCDTTR